MRLRLSVVGRRDDYACVTAYLWLQEVRDLILDEYRDVVDDVEVAWEDAGPHDEELGIPAIKVGDQVVYRGLPAEAGYLFEILKHHLDRVLRHHLEGQDGSQRMIG